MFMAESDFYYDTGAALFQNDEAIFINRAVEQVESHLHAHDFIEIAYVISGQGLHRIGAREYAVAKGDLFLINYDIPHEFRSLPGGRGKLEVYNCIFKPAFLDYTMINCRDFTDITHHFLFRSLFPEESTDRADIKLLARDSWEIAELYEKMYREYQLQDQGYLEILRAYVIELLIRIFRLYRAGMPEQNNELQHRRMVTMEKIIQYMKQNYAADLKLADFAMMAFLSRNYFCQLFKDTTGVTVSEYLQKIRVEEACRLLQGSDKKVIEIAGEVGYSDLKHFNMVFKKITGKTPGEYRKGCIVRKGPS
jgi:AraC-like DNA-binding protein/mannose-6-phosphate isomerase-like protein (cupin superfamily)